MIIDRFENDFAIVELQSGTFCNLPVQALPAEAKEGDCLTIAVDVEETVSRKVKMQEKMNRLFID